MKITKDMTIGTVVRYHPEVVNTLMSMGMGCIGCPSAQVESIEEAAAVHGQDADKIVEALNKVISQ